MKARNFGFLSVFVASLCCLGPLILALLGLGSLGAGAFLAKYHIYFMLGGGLLLLSAWRSYFVERRQCAEKSCPVPDRRLSFVVLMIASGIVVTVLGLNLFNRLQRETFQTQGSSNSHFTEVITVEGMHCFTCEIAVGQAIKKLPGIEQVKVSSKEGKAVVTFNEAETSLDAIVKAINQSGYRAKQKGAENHGTKN